ncbi:UDP-n-acetylhexosamine pyrophosphorylase [Cyclospora cayetanensis]|uniref:UDP-N-acetylglucosamine diphosphorylase n=1 Tax=Cyclospora cayetanensis TaxID=88456 RepID=A0A1D3CTY2_9EIME|nr:UDP-n-acetylhexosamine pyrophosphorylase [Cyclospora cayetanensis]
MGCLPRLAQEVEEEASWRRGCLPAEIVSSFIEILHCTGEDLPKYTNVSMRWRGELACLCEEGVWEALPLPGGVTMATSAASALRSAYEAAGQGHVFRFFDRLSDVERQQLLADLEKEDPHELRRLLQEALKTLQLTDDSPPRQIKPPHAVDLTPLSTADFPQQPEQLLNAYRQLLPPSAACLVVPLRDAPQALRQQWRDRGLRLIDYFGLNPSDVRFFSQGTIPAFDLEGHLMLAAAHQLRRTPDGNGGVFKALQISGILADMQQRKLEGIQILSVDNALAKVADPTFFGFACTSDADVGLPFLHTHMLYFIRHALAKVS